MLDTIRLRLRAFTVDDAPFLLALVNSPGWLTNIGDRGVHNLEEAADYIRQRILPAYGNPGLGAYLLVRKRDGSPIGTCGIYERPGLEVPDLGFALLPEYFRQGYATEAAGAVLAQARAIGMEEVLAICRPENAGSIGLLKKLGFERSGRVTLPGDAEELLLLRLVL